MSQSDIINSRQIQWFPGHMTKTLRLMEKEIRNVDCVYGFRRHKNQISMMHIDKGNYLEMLEGAETEKTGAGTAAE